MDKAPAFPPNIGQQLVSSLQGATSRAKNDAEKRLLETFRALNEQDRQSLSAFAAFLADRAASASGTDINAPGGAAPADSAPLTAAPVEPVFEPGPSNESVVAAIRRLSKIYSMLDKSTMLTETSELMTAHVMRGRAADAVIADLEALFEQRYRAMLEADAQNVDDSIQQDGGR